MHMFDDHDEAEPLSSVSATLEEALVSGDPVPAHEASPCSATSNEGLEDLNVVSHESKRLTETRLQR
jgi:hypothetical protein